MQPALEILSQGQSSSEPDGDRSIWDLVWKAKVPHKMRVFAWKVATSTLAVCENVHRRIVSVDAMCPICGVEGEDDHHALVRCTIARALRDELRKSWDLPSEENFYHTGREWLFHLLANTSILARAQVIFLLWRVWHHRNDIIHGDGKASVAASAPYLVNYLNSFHAASTTSFDPKGKAPMHPIQANPERRKETAWVAPREGELKANVDAGWDPLTKKTGTAAIIRDHGGQVVVAAWNSVEGCLSPEEAEIHAGLLGLRLLISTSKGPATLESDCHRLVITCQEESVDRSTHWALYSEFKELLRVYNHISICKVDRRNNRPAHALGQLGKAGSSGISWGSPPSCVSDLVDRDCMNIV
jgi:hypothetical protein